MSARSADTRKAWVFRLPKAAASDPGKRAPASTSRAVNEINWVSPTLAAPLAFTGAASGVVDWADLLLGMPATALLATGPADRYLRANDWAAFLLTEWLPSTGFTVNAGARSEYASPYAERYRRLTNLDLTNGFATATVVTASPGDSTLVRPFRAMIELRVSLAWLPLIGSSLVVRAGAFEGVLPNDSSAEIRAPRNSGP